MAFVLDTDIFSLSVRNDPQVIQRIIEYDGLIFLSAVALRETLKGALAAIADAESPTPRFRNITVADTYDLLIGLVARATQFPILPYTNTAEAIFQQLPKNIQRVGPRDCRIAASAVASGMTVVTANTRHFEQIAQGITELRFVNWKTE